MNADAVGYLLIECISSIRQERNTIEEKMKKSIIPPSKSILRFISGQDSR